MRCWALLLATWLLVEDLLSYFEIIVQANLMDISSLDLDGMITRHVITDCLAVATIIFCSSNSCCKGTKSSFVTTSAVGFGLHKPGLLLVQPEVAHELLWCLWGAGTFVVADFFVVFWALV